jgi:hypothetical protein
MFRGMSVIGSILVASTALVMTTLLIAPAAAGGYCERGWGECPDRLGGGCAPMNSVCCPGGKHVDKGESCPVSEAGSWGAVAAALWNDSNGRSRVATGAAWRYSTMEEASDAAMSGCKQRGGEDCRVLGTFKNGGCGYIATGDSDDGVGYGTGSSESDAINTCRSKGLNCLSAAGGCTVAVGE